MPDYEIIDVDIIIDIIHEILDIIWDLPRDIPRVGELPPGELPFTPEYLEVVIKNPEVREVVAKRVREAQAQGHEFPLPSGPELAAARERQLARRKRGA